MRLNILLTIVLIIQFFGGYSQGIRDFIINDGDTVNRIDNFNLKQGKWVHFLKDDFVSELKFYKKNQITSKGNYVNGIKSGKWIYNYPDGKLKCEIYYENGIPNGEYKFYDEKGKISESGKLITGNWTECKDVNGNKKRAHYNTNGNFNSALVVTGNVKKDVTGITGIIKKEYKAIDDCDIQILRNGIDFGIVKPTNGSYNFRLDFHNKYEIRFYKEKLTTKTIEINTYIPLNDDTGSYSFQVWDIVLNDKIAFIENAGNEVFNVLLNKPIGIVKYNRKKHCFESDRAYTGYFKKEIEHLSEGTKAILAKAAEDNAKLELENLKKEAELKAKEIELLKKDQDLKTAELDKKQAQILKQKMESDQKAQDLEMLAQERKIQKLQYEQQKIALEKQQMEAERKAREIEKLNETNKIKELELAQSELQVLKQNKQLSQSKAESELKEKEISVLNKEKEIQKIEAKQDAQFRFYLSIVLAVVIGFAIYMVYTFRQKQKANILLASQKQEIEEQNEELNQQNEEILAQRDEIEVKSKLIEEKNKDITDSITYANRIQQAILPSELFISHYLKNCFVLFKPKDIVSGDFYYFTSVNRTSGRGLSELENLPGDLGDDLIILAVADCTGHGVPGGFMSMVGNSLLNQIIIEKKIYNPAHILQRLHEGIVTTLKQEENTVKDGMEIAVCTIDLKNNLMEFASANRPLYIIRKDKSFEEIKPSKHPIGGLHDEELTSFVCHNVPIESGTQFYISTDGFPDQFGGTKGKKIMTKRLKELLINNSDKTTLQQEKHLNDFFENWRGELEQIDDVLVMGVRI